MFFFYFEIRWNNTDLLWSIIMKFRSLFCSDYKLMYGKKREIHTLISTFHFRIYNYIAHLSNVLKLSRSFETQWNLFCWKYKFNELCFGTSTNSTNLRIHELVIFSKTTKIDTHDEKYFHSIKHFYWRETFRNRRVWRS